MVFYLSNKKVTDTVGYYKGNEKQMRGDGTNTGKGGAKQKELSLGSVTQQRTVLI